MQQIREQLAVIRQQGLFRELKTLAGPQQPVVLKGSREYLLMASNSYLGIATHPEVIEASRDATARFGTGSGGSRLISGNTILHEELESALAKFKGTADAIVFNSGYMANLGTISALADQDDVIFSDELNHASIIDGCRLSRARVKVYRHGDLSHLESFLAEESTSNTGRKLIITDGVFSMDGDLAPLPGIVNLARQYKAMVMVDDAHGTGVLGEKGRGTVEYFGLKDQVDIQMGTLSKALGSEGGFVAGNRELIQYLRNKARTFIFSTGLAPGVIAAALAALKVVDREPWRRDCLAANANHLREGLDAMGFRVIPACTPIIPVITGETEATVALARVLDENGVFAPAIRPPTVPPGTSRIRVTVMATHTTEQLDKALEIFWEAGRQVGLL